MEKWYVILTGANRESDTYLNLRRQGYAVFYPRRWHTWSRNGHTTSELRPFLSRYLFAAVGAHQSVMAINETDGVSRVLTQAGNAYEIPLETMWALRKGFDPDGVEPPNTRTASHMRKLLRGVKGEDAAAILSQIKRLDDGGNMRYKSDRGRAPGRRLLPLTQRKTAGKRQMMASCGAFA